MVDQKFTVSSKPSTVTKTSSVASTKPKIKSNDLSLIQNPPSLKYL